MARIRTIKPEFYVNEELSALPAETHLFAGALLNQSDDEGYFNAHPGLLMAAIFPIRECSLSARDMLIQLSKIGFIRTGKTADGKHFGHVVNFLEHQRINRPTPSKIKKLSIVWEDSLSTHTPFNEDSQGKGRKGKEGKGRNISSRLRSTESDIFSKAYECYPRHVGRGAASKAWNKAVGRRKSDRTVEQTEDFLFNRVMTYGAACIAANREKNFIPHMATWLNEDRFLDDPSEWDVKPAVNGHTPTPPDEYGGHFEGTVYVKADGTRMPGYRPPPKPKAAGGVQ